MGEILEHRKFSAGRPSPCLAHRDTRARVSHGGHGKCARRAAVGAVSGRQALRSQNAAGQPVVRREGAGVGWVGRQAGTVEARAPINAQRGGEGSPRGYRRAPRQGSISLILINPHGTARGALLQNVAGPLFSEFRGHPGGTWGVADAVIPIG